MPRIEPVPVSEIDDAAWQRVLRGAEAGHASVEFAGVLAYHSDLFKAHVERLGARVPGVLLGSRLSELVRLRSSQLGGCEQCQAARYEDSVSEDDVACMPVGSGEQFTPREQAALEFVRMMHLDHFNIDDAAYRSLHEHFSVAEIVELGMMVAGLLGVHRFLRTLDLLGSTPPAIEYQAKDVFRGAVVNAASLA
jgi:alkylhydroperoxidase family enzyme